MRTTIGMTLVSLMAALSACRASQRTTGSDTTPAGPCCPETVYEMPEVEEAAVFPGGDAALFAWVGNNLVYPPEAAEMGVDGTCWVQFNIECDGTPTDIVLQKGVEPHLDSAAMDLARRIPAWTPAKIKGKPVCVQYILPVKFTLK